MLQNSISDFFRKLRLISYSRIFSNIEEKDGSLSATEAFSVDAINLLGTPTMKQFSEFIGVSAPNATYKINCLISKGYVTREVSQRDKRELVLHLTDKFYKYYGDSERSVSFAVEELRKTYTDSEIEKFSEMLNALTDALV